MRLLKNNNFNTFVIDTKINKISDMFKSSLDTITRIGKISHNSNCYWYRNSNNFIVRKDINDWKNRYHL